MDFGKAFTYIFEDKNWVGKIGIGALISFLSFLILPAFLLGGYSIGIMRNVKKGVENPLPEWDDWGTLFTDGISAFIAQFVYTIPFLVVVCITFAFSGGLASLADLGGAGEDAAVAGAVGALGIGACALFLYALAMVFIMPAVRVQYVKHNSLNSMFKFREVIAIVKNNLSDILLIVAVLFGIGIVFSIVLSVFSVIPCLGWIVSLVLSVAFGPYMGMVAGHLLGQLAEKDSHRNMG